MAARSNWKGHHKLSLVSGPVALYPAASSSSRARFNKLNRKTGNKVERQFVDLETLGEVEGDDQVKGYAIGKNTNVLVEGDEFDQIRIEGTHTIEIESLVPRSEVDERHIDTPYYIAPNEKVGQDAFAAIRYGMREKGKAGSQGSSSRAASESRANAAAAPAKTARRRKARAPTGLPHSPMKACSLANEPA